MKTYLVTENQLKHIEWALKLSEYFVQDEKNSDSDSYESDNETLEAALLAFDNIIDNQEVTQ